MAGKSVARGRKGKGRDTICGLASPPGLGSIAVIRLSGPDALAIVERHFSGPSPSRQPSHTIRLGWFVENGGKARVDQVMLAVFRSPRSYTGEDMVEISCHGGPFIVEKILRILEQAGCRRAEPGEFSRRAVLAGKFTLSQAEAVLELVQARSPAALQAALARYEGGLSRVVGQLLEDLRSLCALAEYHLSCDESDSASPAALNTGVRSLLHRLDRIIREGERGRLVTEGARVVIVGRPNVGKSSLFNQLLGAERALVTPLPGTTRDRLEASVVFGDVPVLLCDTAGLASDGRQSGQIAVLSRRQTLAAVEQADLVLAVFDGSEPLRAADRQVLAAVSDRPVWYIINKRDMPGWRVPEELESGKKRKEVCLGVSALTGANIARLRRLLERRFRFSGSPALAAGRHLELFRQARAALGRSLEAAAADAAAAELRTALTFLEEIDGKGTAGDVLDRVFARFCVGK